MGLLTGNQSVGVSTVVDRDLPAWKCLVVDRELTGIESCAVAQDSGSLVGDGAIGGLNAAQFVAHIGGDHESGELSGEQVSGNKSHGGQQH